MSGYIMADIPGEPKRSAADVAYAVIKAGVSAVPVAGGPAAELLGLIFGPPLEKRRDRWIDELASAVKEVQGKIEDLTPEKLSANEAFVTTAMRASEIAIRTHEEDKLDALRNAVVNTALPDAPNDTLQQIFLNYVDSLTAWHLRILAFFDDPADWGRKHNVRYPDWQMGAPSAVLECAMPELRGQRGFYDLIVNDLEQRGLKSGGGLHTTMTASGMLSPRIAPLGKEFLNFISRR